MLSNTFASQRRAAIPHKYRDNSAVALIRRTASKEALAASKFGPATSSIIHQTLTECQNITRAVIG